ncbi:ribosome recycling factor [Mycoplasmopsis alligatoris]|uniref:Ribosome-recycling factor n=1 Tax=Mycoplasmopsis alligatoris A21JP2 TaxID=747682 RepID=D4XVH3_9BACT|nr:ribosome recycling factor [Mycoplasmopsis alligatoris]EFF41613.1 ribosome recycling factor [Mycoplasmopsis alligatoris A21JP2]
MELDLYLLELDEVAHKAINHYKFELSKMSTGRANPQVIKGVRVNYYETLTPLEELSTISVPEPQQLLIKPYDSSSTKEIVKALTAANLGILPVDEGHQVRMTFPTLTTDRRKELVKSLSKLTEGAKIGIRNARQEVNKAIKADEELSEDIEKRYLDAIQKEVDKYMELVNEITKEKESDLMKI